MNALRQHSNKKNIRMLINQSAYDPTSTYAFMGKGGKGRSEKVPESEIFTLSLKSGKHIMYACMYV